MFNSPRGIHFHGGISVHLNGRYTILIHMFFNHIYFLIIEGIITSIRYLRVDIWLFYRAGKNYHQDISSFIDYRNIQLINKRVHSTENHFREGILIFQNFLSRLPHYKTS